MCSAAVSLSTLRLVAPQHMVLLVLGILITTQLLASANGQSEFAISPLTPSISTLQLGQTIMFSGTITPVPPVPNTLICPDCLTIRLEAQGTGYEAWVELSPKVDALGQSALNDGEYLPNGNFVIYWKPEWVGQFMVRAELVCDSTSYCSSTGVMGISPAVGSIEVTPAYFAGLIPVYSLSTLSLLSISIPLVLVVVAAVLVLVLVLVRRRVPSVPGATGQSTARIRASEKENRMVCASCGHRNPAYATKYCVRCGAKFATD